MADRPTGVRAHRSQRHRERILRALRFVRGDCDALEKADGGGLAEQRFLDPLALRDVLDLRNKVERGTAVVAHERHGQVDPHLVAVGVEIPLLHRVAGDLICENPAHELEIGLEIVGVRDVLERLGHELVSRIADDLAQRRIHLKPATVDPYECHPDRCAVERQPEALVRFP